MLDTLLNSDRIELLFNGSIEVCAFCSDECKQQKNGAKCNAKIRNEQLICHNKMIRLNGQVQKNLTIQPNHFSQLVLDETSILPTDYCSQRLTDRKSSNQLEKVYTDFL